MEHECIVFGFGDCSWICIKNLIIEHTGIDILLVPPIANPVREKYRENFIPAGLPVLMAELLRHSIRARIYHPEKIIISGEDYAAIALDILSWRPRAVGFSTWCQSYPTAIMIADEIKRIAPAVPVIFGGPQVTALARETMETFGCVDYILKGESEDSLVMLLQNIMAGRLGEKLDDIPGLVYRLDGNMIRENCCKPGRVNLDSLEIPAYEEVLDRENVRLDAGRGCPFRCSYCSTCSFFGRKYRTKSPGRIIREIEYCQKHLETHFVGFAHDMLTFNKAFIYELCGRLRQYSAKPNAELNWSCSSRLDCVDPEMLQEMHDAGCRFIFFGMETGSAKIQRQINKNLDIQSAHDIIECSVRKGIETTVSYMAGFPGETEKDLALTLDSVFHVTAMGAEVQMTLLSVLPGTAMYNNYLPYLKYDGHYSGFSDEYLCSGAEKLVKNNRDIFSSFFYLPNRYLSRKLLRQVSALVNFLRHFAPTLALLDRETRMKGIGKKLITALKNQKNDQHADEKVLPFLFRFLGDFVADEARIPANAGMWDVFQVDFVKALMADSCCKMQSVIDHTFISGINDEGLPPDAVLRIRPTWQIMHTGFNLGQLYNCIRKGMTGILPLPAEDHAYLVAGISESSSVVLHVDPSTAELMTRLKEMTVRQYLRLVRGRYGREGQWDFLRKIHKYRMISIHTKA